MRACLSMAKTHSAVRRKRERQQSTASARSAAQYQCMRERESAARSAARQRSECRSARLRVYVQNAREKSPAQRKTRAAASMRYRMLPNGDVFAFRWSRLSAQTNRPSALMRDLQRCRCRRKCAFAARVRSERAPRKTRNEYSQRQPREVSAHARACVSNARANRD